MYKPVKFITEIPYRDFSTYYLFCKDSKILVPIEIYNEKINEAYPSVHNSIARIIAGVEYKISNIKIYRHYNGIFYTYIRINKGSRMLDINISLKDGLEISKETSSPLYINDSILKTTGIKITKDLVLKALRDK